MIEHVKSLFWEAIISWIFRTDACLHLCFCRPLASYWRALHLSIRLWSWHAILNFRWNRVRRRRVWVNKWGNVGLAASYHLQIDRQPGRERERCFLGWGKQNLMRTKGKQEWIFQTGSDSAERGSRVWWDALTSLVVLYMASYVGSTWSETIAVGIGRSRGNEDEGRARETRTHSNVNR